MYADSVFCLVLAVIAAACASALVNLTGLLFTIIVFVLVIGSRSLIVELKSLRESSNDLSTPCSVYSKASKGFL